MFLHRLQAPNFSHCTLNVCQRVLGSFFTSFLSPLLDIPQNSSLLWLQKWKKLEKARSQARPYYTHHSYHPYHLRGYSRPIVNAFCHPCPSSPILFCTIHHDNPIELGQGYKDRRPRGVINHDPLYPLRDVRNPCVSQRCSLGGPDETLLCL